ncbi:MAG: phosphohistidine phosphatase SixA [Nitrospira sp.]|jgi:phosphohistidine phosphatase|nr:MAG: phosphohistidine phosphatase SixA [Nitrospira sp.]
MKCVLFRHGIAVDREEWKGEEAQRPLTSKGEKRAQEAAEGLVRLKIAPTHIVSSPYIRALETAKILKQICRNRPELQVRDELLPEANPEKLVQFLAGLPEEACVVCVGHEPHLGETAGVMLFGKPVEGLALKKAGGCLIEFESGPKSGRGRLTWWLTAGQLRTLAGD